MDYLSALRRTSALLDAKFTTSEDINHNPSKGAFREFIVKNCIRPFLPEAYGISNGECFDINGSVSKQLDIVVYDKLFSYVVPYSDEFIQFPFESVYGNIEVKSMLNKNELFSALDNIASLKKLKREKADPAQILPNRSFHINGIQWDDTTNYYDPFGIIFAFGSLKAETIVEHLREKSIGDIPYLPEMIVLYNEKTIIFRIKYEKKEDGGQGWYVSFYGDYDGFIAVPCGKDTLPIFITEVLIHSSYERISAMSIADIINPVIDNVLHLGEDYKTARLK